MTDHVIFLCVCGCTCFFFCFCLRLIGYCSDHTSLETACRRIRVEDMLFTLVRGKPRTHDDGTDVTDLARAGVVTLSNLHEPAGVARFCNAHGGSRL